MKHGELKHKIVIERPVGAQDSAGQEIMTWHEVATVMASIEQLSARERFVGGAQLQATATHRIRTQYTTALDGMDASWRVLFGIRLFQLVSPQNNVRERNREIELMCTEYPEL